jgi:ribosome biogenesis GTPase A
MFTKNGRGRLALAGGEVQLGRLGRIRTLAVVFGMLGYVLVPTTPALRVAHVENWACKSVGMKKNW